MQKPEKPLPSDCCSSGCMICVYDIYADQLKKYKKWLRDNQEKEQTPENPRTESNK